MKALTKGDGALVEVGNVSVRHAGTSEGTGADQEITHGFTVAPDRLELVPLEAGVIFSGLTVAATKFNVTITSGKDWAWVADRWST
jgi:hypothetical protein